MNVYPLSCLSGLAFALIVPLRLLTSDVAQPLPQAGRLQHGH